MQTDVIHATKRPPEWTTAVSHFVSLRVTPLFVDDPQSFTHILSLQLRAWKTATETPSVVS